jgi:hypothetical protein
LYVGVDASTSVAPVRMFIATTAPQRFPSCCIASRCADGSIVSTRLFPFTVPPPSRSSWRRHAFERFVFEPVR